MCTISADGVMFCIDIQLGYMINFSSQDVGLVLVLDECLTRMDGGWWGNNRGEPLLYSSTSGNWYRISPWRYLAVNNLSVFEGFENGLYTVTELEMHHVRAQQRLRVARKPS